MSGLAGHQVAQMGKPLKSHQVGEDGLLLTIGIRLCKQFQVGECKSFAPGTTMICGVDGGQVHQCARCLQPGHGAAQCKNPSARSPASTKGSGKSKSRN
eukprot:6464007-Amphidinium_carterae.2